MPRIQPLELDAMDPACRAALDAGLANGMYTMTLPMQIMAHSPSAFQDMDEGYKALFRRGVLAPRIQELIRLRSAQLNACEPCSLSRKDGSVAGVCAVDGDDPALTLAERRALKFFDLLALDHHAIDEETYRELGEVFSVAEILELGVFSAQAIGMHRLMHSFDILGSGAPVLGRGAG
ncbi:MAG: hypothetical protein RBS40_06490 [Rhodocyclaceae bacterium]|jgi:alkylhydroperoxidase family enzyme|nr:hypothetical protein [Rhodocyclaceae bacterium]